MENSFNFRKASPLLLFVLVCGLIIEGTNLQSLFFSFCKLYRPDWRDVTNGFVACFFSAGLLGAILTYGLRNDKVISWALALLTMAVSLFVYREVAKFDLDNLTLQHNHIVVLIIAIVFPFLVAYTTHQLHNDQVNEPSEKDELMKQVTNEVKALQLQRQVKHYARQVKMFRESSQAPQISEPRTNPQPSQNPMIEELKQQEEDREKK